MLFLIDLCTTPWWLAWLLPFLLGLLLGWLIWGRLKGRITELEEQNTKLKSKQKKLDDELTECRSAKAGMESENALLQGRLREQSRLYSNRSIDKVSNTVADVQTSDPSQDSTKVVSGELERAKETEVELSQGNVDQAISSGGSSALGILSDSEEGTIESKVKEVEIQKEESIGVSSTAQSDGGEAYGTDGKDDDYKPLSFYVENGSGVANGFDSFAAAGESYFSYNIDGQVHLISEGYKSDSSRDNGIKSVKKNMINDARYKRQQHPNGKHFFNLRAGNNQEIATSAWYDSEQEMNGVIGRLSAGSGFASKGSEALGVLGGSDVASKDGSEKTQSLTTKTSSASDRKNIYASLSKDNLQIVEGIGPKMNEVLNNAGVMNLGDLSKKTPEEIRAILDSVNAKRYRIIDPSSWPKQAGLANNESWTELISVQKNLDSGRAQGATGETDSKVEKLLIKMGVLKRWKDNDLTAVEGVGPKISGLLRDGGFTTWRSLANADVSKLQDILDAAGKRYKLADPSSWPKQAEMAADGRWDDLQEYQDFLQGGK